MFNFEINQDFILVNEFVSELGSEFVVELIVIEYIDILFSIYEQFC